MIFKDVRSERDTDMLGTCSCHHDERGLCHMIRVTTSCRNGGRKQELVQVTKMKIRMRWCSGVDACRESEYRRNACVGYLCERERYVCMLVSPCMSVLALYADPVEKDRHNDVLVFE